MYEHVYYMGMCFILLEMLLVQSPVGFLGLGLSGIMFTSGLCVWGGLELLGLAVIAVYSSVFLFLSAIAMYLGGAWELGGWTRWGSLVFKVWVVVASGLLCYALTLEAEWEGSEVIWQDYYALVDSWGTSMVTIVHMMFMRLFALESLFLNLYILFGLVACLAVLGLVVSIGGGGYWGRARLALSQTRRIATPACSRRSWRRRNSSVVRELVWFIRARWLE